MAAHGLTENLATWEAVRTVTGFTGLLVGNGASCAVWAGFAYESLFDVALNVNDTCRLAAADVALFERSFFAGGRLGCDVSRAGNGMSAMRVLRFASAARAGSVSRPSSLWRPTKCA